MTIAVSDPPGQRPDRRWYKGSAPHAEDDEFNDGTIGPAWARLDTAGGSSRATWSEGGDSLSLLLNGGDAAAETHSLLRPYALAVGEAIQCHVTAVGAEQNFTFGGLIVGDGNTYGAGSQAAMPMFCQLAASNGGSVVPSEWTGYNTRATYIEVVSMYFRQPIHMRLKRQTSTTWQHLVSADGISWALLQTRTLAITPSHVGFFGGTWGAANPFNFAFDYFRVV